MPYETQNIAFMLGHRSPERWEAVAEAHLVIFDRRFRIFLASDGTVSMPDTVRDPAKRFAVACQFRELALAQLSATWQTRTSAEAER